jgi:hypothetical protein
MTGTIRHRGPEDEGYGLINTTTASYRFASGPESAAEIRQTQPPINALNQE